MSDPKSKKDAVDNQAVEVWFEKNWKKCLAGVIALIVIVMAIFLVIYQSGRRAEKGAEALAGASVEELPLVLADNSKSAGMAAARLKLAAHLQSEKKDFAAAKIQYAMIASDKDVARSIRENARISAAKCDESLGKKKEAAEMLLIIANDNSVTPSIRDDAGFQAGRILLELKDARGKEILEKISKTPESSPYKDMAESLLQSI